MSFDIFFGQLWIMFQLIQGSDKERVCKRNETFHEYEKIVFQSTTMRCWNILSMVYRMVYNMLRNQAHSGIYVYTLLRAFEKITL